MILAYMLISGDVNPGSDGTKITSCYYIRKGFFLSPFFAGILFEQAPDLDLGVGDDLIDSVPISAGSNQA